MGGPPSSFFLLVVAQFPQFRSFLSFAVFAVAVFFCGWGPVHLASLGCPLLRLLTQDMSSGWGPPSSFLFVGGCAVSSVSQFPQFHNMDSCAVSAVSQSDQLRSFIGCAVWTVAQFPQFRSQISCAVSQSGQLRSFLSCEVS